jgi:hypothetical protein
VPDRGFRIPRAARADWDALEAVRGSVPVDRGAVAAPGSAARRWLERALPAGAPAARAAVIETRGEIRLGDRRRPLRARQVIVPGRGFVWAARVGRGPAAVTGFDRYLAGAGAMRWRLLGVPVVSAAGPDIDRSAAGRLAAETLLVPPALVGSGVGWDDAGPDSAVARVREGDAVHRVTVVVDGDGRLAEVSLARWGSPGGGPFREAVFRVRMEGEARHDGIALPAGYEAGWDDDPAGAFMRCEVLGARLR